MTRPLTSFRLSNEVKAKLDKLAQKENVNKTKVIEDLINKAFMGTKWDGMVSWE